MCNGIIYNFWGNERREGIVRKWCNYGNPFEFVVNLNGDLIWYFDPVKIRWQMIRDLQDHAWVTDDANLEINVILSLSFLLFSRFVYSFRVQIPFLLGNSSGKRKLRLAVFFERDFPFSFPVAIIENIFVRWPKPSSWAPGTTSTSSANGPPRF